MKATVTLGSGGGAKVEEGHRPDPLDQGPKDTLSDSLSGDVVQADTGSMGGDDPVGDASSGVSSASSPIPHQDPIQSSFGKHDVGGIKSATGGEAASAAKSLGTTAFATGEKVGFASSPDLHTAAHEAAHVVQQRGGVQLYGGVGQAGDVYEQHADQVADKVVAGESAEGLLDKFAGSGSADSGNVQRNGGGSKLPDIKASSFEKSSVTLEGPAFGVPGLKWNIEAEGEREVETEAKRGGETETTVSASLTGGIRYDLWFLEVGLDLVGELEIKVEGNVPTGEALTKGVTEVARWYGAKRLGDIAERRADIESRFKGRRDTILEAYRELTTLLNDSSFEDFQSGATSWFYFSTSPRQKAAGAIDGLKVDIGVLFGLAKATGDQVSAAKAFVDKDALLADFASAANTTKQNGRRQIDRSRGRFLDKFDPAKDSILQSFDNLDAMKVLTRSPDTQFTGTVGANAVGKFGWGGGGSDGGEDGDEIEMKVGVAKRISSGEDTLLDLASKDVVRGSMEGKVGDYGAELAAERESEGPDQVKWGLEVELKKEALIDKEQAAALLGAWRKGLMPLGRNSMRLANISDVKAAMRTVGEVAKQAAIGAGIGGGLAHSGVIEGESEAALGAELELEWERDDSSKPFQLKGREGSVSIAALGGVKAGADLGSLASKLGKVEASYQKGWKVSASY